MDGDEWWKLKMGFMFNVGIWWVYHFSCKSSVLADSLLMNQPGLIHRGLTKLTVGVKVENRATDQHLRNLGIKIVKTMLLNGSPKLTSNQFLNHVELETWGTLQKLPLIWQEDKTSISWLSWLGNMRLSVRQSLNMFERENPRQLFSATLIQRNVKHV